MSLFISGMNLSVILFPPANLCPSSLRAHLSSLDQTQWRELLPKSFQHQLFRLLQGEEVIPGSSPVASGARGHCGTSEHWPGLQWPCPAPLVSRSGTVRWKGSWCRVHWAHSQWHNPSMGCLVEFPGQTNSILGWVIRCCHNPGSNFNVPNPWDMRVILKFQDSSSDFTILIHQFNPCTAWTHPAGSPPSILLLTQGCEDTQVWLPVQPEISFCDF